MDRLDAMSLFARIVDEGSLSAAARKLALPLATASRKLSDLERHLGTRLLTRSTRRLVLTDAGRDYLAACRGILERVEEAERTATGTYAAVRGELVVAAPIVFGRMHVVPVVAAFLESHPDVDVRLLLGDRVVNLLEEDVDIAIRIGELGDSGLVAIAVGATRRVVCASPGYVAKHGKLARLEDLARHRCITFEGLASSTSWSFPGAKGPRRIGIRTRLSVNTAEAAIDAAVAGLGVTRVLSYQVERLLREGRLVRCLAAHEPPSVPIHVVHAGQGRVPMKSRAFIDFAVPRLRGLESSGTRPKSRRRGPVDVRPVIRNDRKE